MRGERVLALTGAAALGLAAAVFLDRDTEDSAPGDSIPQSSPTAWSQEAGATASTPRVEDVDSGERPPAASSNPPVPRASRELAPSSDWTGVEEPPVDPMERQAWHMAHAVPAWTDLEAGLQISRREQLQVPVSDLLDRLDQAAGGVSESEYQEILAQERQLLGTLRVNHPRLFPILEPMERIEDMLERLEPEP